MKRLLLYIVLFSLVLGIALTGARPPLAKQQIEKTSLLASQLSVGVTKVNKQLEFQPLGWVFKDTKKVVQQPLLQLVKDANNPDLADESTTKESKQSDLKPFDEVVKNTSAVKGLFTLYSNKEGSIYLEIKPEQLNKNYLSTVTMESGIGERGIYSGMPLHDFLFYFRRVNNNLHFVVRNVNFRTSPGSPQARSLDRSFSDSVLYSLPIKSIHPKHKTILIDLGDLLLKDLPGLSSALSSQLQVSYQLDEKKSYFGDVKGFPLNVEIESVYGFSADGKKTMPLPTLPDSRALTLRVRYSLSQLPENHSYQPRLADDRVGYFITAYQDFSIDNRKEPFVRYINRWHLEKQNPNLQLSPPKKPIVFWIENAVPLEYRDAVKEGILIWNKAFEKAGFKDAIEVRQMPNDAQWDPADVRYNTIRWINTVDGFFALGPSRVNPLTGEILDADIVVDGSFVRSLNQDYRNLVLQNQSQPTSLLSHLIGNNNLCNNGLTTEAESNSSPLSNLATAYDLCYGIEAANQFELGSMALSLFRNIMPSSDQMQDYIHQYLRLVIAHEVGHTLGLRHNFHGSTLLKPEEMNNTQITRTKGLTASVMDYIPPNLAPQGVRQGDYFPAAVGPYDEWTIQYGYTPTQAAHPLAEKRFLEQIAQHSVNPELAYATDEDTFDLDPNVNAWDNSGDVLRYSQWQLDNARAMWVRLNKRYPIKGESYSKVSELFDRVFLYYLRHTYYTTKYVGGQSFRRDHAEEFNERLPFEPIPVEKQRQALATLQKYVFAENAFNFPPQLLNKLAPSRWRHWGNEAIRGRLDYPIHDSIFAMQSFVLRQLLSSDRLTRLRDIELKSQPGQALAMPELFETLQNNIWTEVVQPDGRRSNISSLRRALQREHLEVMTTMVLRTVSVPEDARTLAWYNLRQLRDKLNKSISKSGKLDDYTKAHLEETRDRINKTLNAQIQSR
ncbi:zinc-dependent metalloprotease [Chroococcidiopsis sp. CCMEE 29]|uniref:zinc-dependent metalloprotease n=1 Tax=Chroococcidiopsis sp. CCMEE 29 TaxID=155894 RepID=UPI002021CA44|nr:zinc-dependent metalloprotease [Chroococcidiopsis sp. CCMEE 29]